MYPIQPTSFKAPRRMCRYMCVLLHIVRLLRFPLTLTAIQRIVGALYTTITLWTPTNVRLRPVVRSLFGSPFGLLLT
ncbi:hypothetical protein BN1183_AI_00180 [Pantoea ananatis]|nr:hypothetical protein BN1183_AI_00180 [Pantoea ananatis]